MRYPGRPFSKHVRQQMDRYAWEGMWVRAAGGYKHTHSRAGLVCWKVDAEGVEHMTESIGHEVPDQYPATQAALLLGWNGLLPKETP